MSTGASERGGTTMRSCSHGDSLQVHAVGGPGDSWTHRYYDPATPSYRQRLLFS